MKFLFLVAGIVSLVVGGTAYVASESLWVALIAFGLFLVGSGGFVVPCLIRHGLESERRHECYLFIHSYLVALSVTESLSRSYESAVSSMGTNFHAFDGTLSAMEDREKLEYLVNYFDSDLYRMFLQILKLYFDRGGDVLKLSAELTAESSRVEETEQHYEKMAFRRAGGFIGLWLMALVIVVFVRFGLSNYFSILKASWTYLGSLIGFYAFFILSLCVYAYFLTGVMPYSFKRRPIHAQDA